MSDRLTAGLVAILGAIYLVVLSVGLSASPAGSPIGDPWFALMELLILFAAPAMVAMMAALYERTNGATRVPALLAVVFMAIMAALTCAVHFVILCLGRSAAFAEPPWTALFAFRWPSLAYAVDILAWDLFFPLSLLCALPALGDRFGPLIKGLFVLAALLALVGLLGPLLEAMVLRNIGILGYALVFPVAAALVAVRAGE